MNADEGCENLHTVPISEQPVLVGGELGLANTVVYIKRGLEGKTFEAPANAVLLDQKGCMFVPRVIGLQTGQTLQVRNSDPVSHNIHPMPKNNRDWNQQQPPGATDLQRKFGFSEVVIPVKCNVHAWMRTYIAVLDHPFFAVTKPDGKFTFKDVPAGDYEIAVWHETLGEKTQAVQAAPGGSATVNFEYR
jgi:plastocyanin